MDVLEYLRSKSLNLKQAGPNNVHTACWYCGEDPAKRGRLYINVDPSSSPPGLFQCKICGEEGAFNKIRKHFGDAALDDDGNLFTKDGSKPASGVVLAVLKDAAEFYHQNLATAPQVMKWLEVERGIAIETISKHRLGWATGGLKQYLMTRGFSLEDIHATGLIYKDGQQNDFFVNRVTIPYIANGQVVQIRGKDMNGKYFTPTSQGVRLYNVDAVWNAHEVIICEGEFDALVLEQFGYATVGLPGSTSWQASWNTYIEKSAKIYTCFDRDEAGAKGYEKVLKEVGPRIRQILMPEHDEAAGEKKNDPSEWIAKKGHTKEDFAALVKAANTTVLVDADDAYSEWLQIENNDLIRTPLGFSNFDKAIGGGLMPGQVMVILAKTGVGKTLALTNIFYHMLATDPKAKVLFFSLEQTRNEWFERAQRIFRFYRETLGEPKTPMSDIVDFYRGRFALIDKNRVDEVLFRQAIEEYQETYGQPTVLGVDYLGYWARAFKGEAYERTTEAIMKLKEIAKDVKIPTISPSQVNRASNGQRLDLASARDAGAVEETADLAIAMNEEMINLSKDESQPNWRMTGDVTWDIKKSRLGGVGHETRFKKTPLSLGLVQLGDTVLDRLVNTEVRWHGQGMHFEEFMLRRRTGVWDEGKPGIEKAKAIERDKWGSQTVSNDRR